MLVRLAQAPAAVQAAEYAHRLRTLIAKPTPTDADADTAVGVRGRAAPKATGPLF